MADPTFAPTAPGEVAGRPKLVVRYRTDAAAVADLLPPGFEAGTDPVVTVGFYCVPVHGEPEHGVSVRIPASFDGVDGQYSLGIGIDQESAIFISQERNGQPKFPCSVRFFQLGDVVEASATHQGHTFAAFRGVLGGPGSGVGEAFDESEWWIKQSRAVGGGRAWDLEPRVVRVRMVGEVAAARAVDGELVLRSSPWDPIADLLPVREQLSAELVANRISSRAITVAGLLDPEAFWPFADTIGGSRWPGTDGGPRQR